MTIPQYLMLYTYLKVQCLCSQCWLCSSWESSESICDEEVYVSEVTRWLVAILTLSECASPSCKRIMYTNFITFFEKTFRPLTRSIPFLQKLWPTSLWHQSTHPTFINPLRRFQIMPLINNYFRVLESEFIFVESPAEAWGERKISRLLWPV